MNRDMLQFVYLSWHNHRQWFDQVLHCMQLVKPNNFTPANIEPSLWHHA